MGGETGSKYLLRRYLEPLGFGQIDGSGGNETARARAIHALPRQPERTPRLAFRAYMIIVEASLATLKTLRKSHSKGPSEGPTHSTHFPCDAPLPNIFYASKWTGRPPPLKGPPNLSRCLTSLWAGRACRRACSIPPRNKPWIFCQNTGFFIRATA